MWYHDAVPMTRKRAVTYIGLASVLLAYLAAAGGLSNHLDVPAAEPRAVQTSGTETLAADVQAQTSRLRDRMASAPAPRAPIRNPFVFGARETPRPRASTPTASASLRAPETAPVVAEPPLELIGIAEQQSPSGPVRTAIMTAHSDELYMLKEGELLGGRYRVKAIGIDAVELTDLVTQAARRVALR
jgi:hypothetical protein